MAMRILLPLLALLAAAAVVPNASAGTGTTCVYVRDLDDPGLSVWWAAGDCANAYPGTTFTCLRWKASDPTNVDLDLVPCLIWGFPDVSAPPLQVT